MACENHVPYTGLHVMDKYGCFSTEARCPYCGRVGPTVALVEPSWLTWLSCGVIGVLGFYLSVAYSWLPNGFYVPCCCVPVCIPACHDVTHYCSTCKCELVEPTPP